MREVIDEQRVGVPITVGQFLGTFEDPAATAGMMEKAGQMGAEISEWVDVPVAESVPVQGGEETGQQGSRTGGGGLPSVIRRQRSIKYRFSRQVPPLSPTVTAVQQMTQQCSNSSQGDGQGDASGRVWSRCSHSRKCPSAIASRWRFFRRFKARRVSLRHPQQPAQQPVGQQARTAQEVWCQLLLQQQAAQLQTPLQALPVLQPLWPRHWLPPQERSS
ncbi:hypothetical protein CLOP_g25418 [Closterium sp. NIES-67]|nr:hypothetical protein CLOP_g25418 [Closterium sp. NIES-67]